MCRTSSCSLSSYDRGFKTFIIFVYLSFVFLSMSPLNWGPQNCIQHSRCVIAVLCRGAGPPAASALPDGALEALCLCHRDALLVYVELAAYQDPQVLLWRAASDHSLSWSLALFPQCFFVELQEVLVSLFLHFLEVSLVAASIWCTTHSSQFCIICKLAALSSINQVINEDTRQYLVDASMNYGVHH